MTLPIGVRGAGEEAGPNLLPKSEEEKYRIELLLVTPDPKPDARAGVCYLHSPHTHENRNSIRMGNPFLFPAVSPAPGTQKALCKYLLNEC